MIFKIQSQSPVLQSVPHKKEQAIFHRLTEGYSPQKQGSINVNFIPKSRTVRKISYFVYVINKSDCNWIYRIIMDRRMNSTATAGNKSSKWNMQQSSHNLLDSAASMHCSYKVTSLIEKLDICSGSCHSVSTERKLWVLRQIRNLYREQRGL